MSDQVILTLPRERPFFAVARLVLGGLATRLDVTVEHLEDLELALDGLLERHDGGSQITISLEVEGDQFLARIGPFHGGELRVELEGDPGDGVSLQRLLDAVVDSYEVSERNDGAWIELSKRIERTA
jgi:hypothetical protein